jgi:periplasmic divalent cation tolerance protein
MALLAVHTSVGSLEEARSLAQLAIEGRLAACVQLEAIESLYTWGGKLVNEPEIRILLKTTTERYAALRDLLLEHHPYDLPAIHAVAVVEVSAAYADWVRASLAPPA